MCKCSLPMQMCIWGELKKEDYNEQALACQGKSAPQAENAQHFGVPAAALATLLDLLGHPALKAQLTDYPPSDSVVVALRHKHRSL